MVREMMRRTVLGILVAMVCGVPATARDSGDAAAADRIYKQAVERLRAEADGSVRLLDEVTAALLPAVQRLLAAGKTELAHRLAEADINALIGLLRDGDKLLRQDLHATVEQLTRLGAKDQANALQRLVEGELLPAVQKECDGSVRKIRALFGDGSV